MKARLLGLGAAFGASFLALPLPSAGATPAANPAQGSFGIESWYQTTPDCSSAPVCPTALAAANPYGAGTLHVAVSAGKETARSYLTLKAQSTSPGQSLDSALLVIPVDTTTTGNGSLQPSTAHLEVCLAHGPLKVADGAVGTPPPTDCTLHAQLVYTDSPEPELSADLSPLMPALRTLNDRDIYLALVPLTGVQGDTWHVVFSAHARATPPTPPASVELSYRIGAPAEPSPTLPATAPTTPPLGTRPGAVAPPVQPPGVSVPLAPTLAPSVPGPSHAVPAALASPVTVTEGFRYPGVLLLPLALAGLAVIAVRAVTLDMSQPAVTRGR